MSICIINGANLNMLGRREPDVYGFDTLGTVVGKCEKLCVERGIKFEHFQSNHEGEIIDFIQKSSGMKYFIANLGAFTHTSIAIRDAFLSIGISAKNNYNNDTGQSLLLELHISNIFKREEFRHKSFISDISIGIISGLGWYGYKIATEFFIEKIKEKDGSKGGN